jgi:hypothetical protein
MTMAVEGLPHPDEHGDRDTWDVTDRDGKHHLLRGLFLGMGSTYRPEHKNHPTTPSAPPRVHCSTCRWTELRLFLLADGKIAVVRCGASNVEGERDLVSVELVETPFELVESLVTKDRRTGQSSLPMPARRALAQAANHDASLRDAYIHSPVAR